MAVQDYKINYKSDFVLNINGDAGWAIPFCIKFWTGMPSQAYFVGFDGVKYVNCRVGDTPTQLLVMFDDHHLPIGKLKMQIAYHTTIEEFPGSVFDEVTNARDVIVTIDGTDYQVLLDFTGETDVELEFNLPAYANEAERIQNELQRQQNEAARIEAELQREQATAAAVQGAENVNAQLSGTTLTVTNRQGVSTSVNTKGERGDRGPVGPAGPEGQTGVSITGFVETGETETATLYNITFSNGTTQAVAIPKGERGDRGPVGPAGPEGQTGVSITGFVETGETETATLYNITFSNGTTQQVAIPKGERGERGLVGPTGPQGPMGDVAVITPEQQASFTMYSETGQNTDGPMTQKAVTDELYNKEEVAISSLPVTSGYCIIGTGNWYQNSSVSCFSMPVSQGDRIRIVANSTNNCIYAILRDFTISKNNPANYATGETGLRGVEAGNSVDIDITQSDAAYLYFTKMANATTDRSPSHIYKLQSLAEGIEENANNISDTIGLHVTSAMPKVRLNKEGYYTSSGTIGSQWTRYRDDYHAEPNMRYIVSSGHTGFGAGSSFAVYVIAFLDSNLNVLGGITPDQVGSAIITDYAVTTPPNCAYISVCKYQTTYATSVFKSPITKNALVEHEERLEEMYEGQCAAIIAQDVNGYWTNVGVLTTASYTRYHDNYMVKPNTKYLVSCGHTGFGVGSNFAVYVIAFLDSGGNCISGIEPDSTVSPILTDWEVTTPSNCVTISIVKYEKTRETKVVEAEKSVPYIIGNAVTKRAFNRFLDGKKYSIVGDSISTYKDLLASSEYAYKYPFDDVTDPALTWWRKMEKYTGLRLLKNCSWSGSRVSGDSTSTSTAAAGCSTKRVKDLAVRDSGGNIVTAPDIILVYMSINDFRFDGMGTWTPSNALPTEGNLTTWREAYATMVSKIIREYPNAEVYCCTLLECTLGVIDVDDNTAWPVINGNGVSLSQWNDSIKEIAIGFGAKVCDIHGCGISYWQVANYTGDLCHPNAAGMELIARKVTQELKAKSFYVI